jgi:predicted CXXCH cytochrome family protein
MKMRTLYALAAFVLLAVPVSAQDEAVVETETSASACIVCHAELDDEMTAPVEQWERDVHATIGLGCVDCHGGDASEAFADDVEGSMSPRAGFVGKPDRLAIADFCARCHSDAEFMKRFDPQGRVDQLAEYRTSVHGKLNAEGDPVPATCTDCHGVHGIRQVSDPDSPVYPTNVPRTCARCHGDEATMEAYGAPTDQYDDYLRSPHAAALLDRQDISAPACNDCHGNHGATPPGLQSVANVCGQCHGREAQLFRQSFKKDLFDELEVAECTVCHGNHRIVHPTPELFRSGSAPSVSLGRIASVEPLIAEVGELPAGETVTLEWVVTLDPHGDEDHDRLSHAVSVLANGGGRLEIDATIRPGEEIELPVVREAESDRLAGTLTIEPRPGLPVKPGDVLVFTLEIRAVGDDAVGGIRVEDRADTGLDVVTGSVCLTCHERGDDCDVATEEIYSAVAASERELRAAEKILHEAEVRGMDVGEVQFDLNSRGVTASMDARALIHTFDPTEMIARAGEAREVADESHSAGGDALDEYQYRRRGLAVSLVLIALVLVGLALKIREIDRTRPAHK